MTRSLPHWLTLNPRFAGWIVACAMLANIIAAPFANQADAHPSPSIPVASLQPSDHGCCDGDACCCGDPDICLCVAECPNTPLNPTRDTDPARPTEHRADLAIPSRSDAIAMPMPFTPRNRAVVAPAPRPASAVRTQAILSIWLT